MESTGVGWKEKQKDASRIPQRTRYKPSLLGSGDLVPPKCSNHQKTGRDQWWARGEETEQDAALATTLWRRYLDAPHGKEGTPTVQGGLQRQCLTGTKRKTMTYSYLSSCSSGAPAAWLPVPRGNGKYYNSLSCLHSLFLDELFPTGALEQGFLPPSGILPARSRGQPYTGLIGGGLGRLWPKKIPFTGSVLRPESPSGQIQHFGFKVSYTNKIKIASLPLVTPSQTHHTSLTHVLWVSLPYSLQRTQLEGQ